MGKEWWVYGWIGVGLATLCFLLHATTSSLYFPVLNAPLTQIVSVLLGIVAIVTEYQSKNKSVQRKVNVVWGVGLLGMGVGTSVALTMCGVYMWCLLWVVAGLRLLKSERRRAKQRRNDFWLEFSQLKNINMRTGLTEYSIQQESTNKSISAPTLTVENQTPTSNVCCLINAFFLLLFTFNALIICYYHTNYHLLGQKIHLKLPKTNQSIAFHTYCSNVVNSSHPTLVLEHGGGGNLVGFLPLAADLQKLGIKTCVYDRLGYGRSSKIVPNVNPEYRAQITHMLLEQILGKNEQIVMGGWSAGVQMSMIYQYYYPERVKALVFMDGYPDYLRLQATVKNATEIRNPKTQLLANLFRVLEPFGFDLLFGDNPITNATLQNYYRAYYRTGHLWDSQSTELKYFPTTEWLNDEAINLNSTPAYPNTHIYLNWPDISIPLLIMPSNSTIGGGNDPTNQYFIQNNKYLQKCTSSLKKLTVMPGAHDFVLIVHQQVASEIHQFLKQL